jgi:hypothetical protein
MPVTIIFLNSSNNLCYFDPVNRGMRGGRGGRKRTRRAGPNRKSYHGVTGKILPAPKVKRYAARTLKQGTMPHPPIIGTRAQFGGEKYEAKKAEDKKGKKKAKDDDGMDIDEKDQDDDAMDVDDKDDGKLAVALHCHCCSSYATTPI